MQLDVLATKVVFTQCMQSIRVPNSRREIGNPPGRGPVNTNKKPAKACWGVCRDNCNIW